MHFWIDKRSSNLHSYIGGGNRARPPGHGGFYSKLLATVFALFFIDSFAITLTKLTLN